MNLCKILFCLITNKTTVFGIHVNSIKSFRDTVSPYVRRCIESFTSDWVIVHRKYKRRVSPIARDRLLQDTPRQDFEVLE